MDIKGKIAQANGRLKAGRIGVSIGQTGDRLWLRATLPPKPGSSVQHPHQQRIYTGFRASPAGLSASEGLAREIGGLLARDKFIWEPYLKTVEPDAQPSGSWVEKFEQHYLDAGGNPETWRYDYRAVFKLIPDNAELTSELLTDLIATTPPNTKSRKRFTMATRALAKFAGITPPGGELAGNYSPATTEPRDIPDDALIASSRALITNPSWRWVYGVMACYGLRNHEAFRLDLSQFPIAQVGDNSKTGKREIWPCYPEWATEWELNQVQLPDLNLNRTNKELGGQVTKYLSPKLPFTPYDLRHAWAIRTMEFGWPVELSARMMGHSVDVHTRTYQRWITGKRIQAVYELLVNRSDRPKPP